MVKFSSVFKKRRKRNLGVKKKVTEHSIQKAFFDYIAKKYPRLRPLCFSIPNEGARNLIQGSLLKQRGLTKGVPDVFCAIPNDYNPGLFIEFKNGSNKLTDSQANCIQRFMEVGYECKVCYSTDEAIKVFEEQIRGL